MANSQLVREQQKLRVRWLVEVFGKVGWGRGALARGRGEGRGKEGRGAITESAQSVMAAVSGHPSQSQHLLLLNCPQ